jgi:hypothetical protein
MNEYSRELMHYAKGEERRGHKYISRKMVNGRWRYTYPSKGLKNAKLGSSNFDKQWEEMDERNKKFREEFEETKRKQEENAQKMYNEIHKYDDDPGQMIVDQFRQLGDILTKHKNDLVSEITRVYKSMIDIGKEVMNNIFGKKR